MTKTIIVLSGGMDSTTLLYKLLNEGKEVKAISFDYGQIHKKELEMARKTCEKVGVDHKIIDVTFLRELLSNSALTKGENVPEGHYANENMVQTVVPNRNMILSSIAIGYAVNEDYDEIALGIHAGDHAVYPDCRPEFANLLNQIAEIANYKSIKVYTPYINKNKIDIVREGTQLGVDYAQTWTSYSSGDEPTGRTGSDVERTEAFIANGLKDPLYSEKGWEDAVAYYNEVVKDKK